MDVLPQEACSSHWRGHPGSSNPRGVQARHASTQHQYPRVREAAFAIIVMKGVGRRAQWCRGKQTSTSPRGQESLLRMRWDHHGAESMPVQDPRQVLEQTEGWEGWKTQRGLGQWSGQLL